MKWKTHGTIHLRRIEIISMAALIVLTFTLLYLVHIKNNYTELHHSVNTLEDLHKGGHE